MKSNLSIINKDVQYEKNTGFDTDNYNIVLLFGQ